MDEPHSLLGPKAGTIGYESSEGGVENTRPAGKFESPETPSGSRPDHLTEAARAVVEDYRGKAENVWGDVQERVRSLQDEGEQYVRDNPTRTIISVLGIGFLLGLIIRR